MRAGAGEDAWAEGTTDASQDASAAAPSATRSTAWGDAGDKKSPASASPARVRAGISPSGGTNGDELVVVTTSYVDEDGGNEEEGDEEDGYGDEDEDEQAAEEERKRNEVNPWTLRYKDPEVETAYRLSRTEQTRIVYRAILAVLTVGFLIFFTLMVLGMFGTDDNANSYKEYYGIPLFMFVLSLAVLVSFEKWTRARALILQFHESFALVFGTLLILQSVIVLGLVGEGSFSPTMWLIQQGVCAVLEGVVVTVRLYAIMIVALTLQHSLAFYLPGASTIMVLLPLFGAMSFALMAVYVMDRSFRKVWSHRLCVEARSRSLRSERTQLEALARLQLPESVIVKLQTEAAQAVAVGGHTSLDGRSKAGRAGSEGMAQRVPVVTVIFVELYGWDKTVQAQDPDSAITLLNTIFTWMDALSAQHGLEKIKTIGSVYLAACNIPDPKADHTEATARFALELLRDWKAESARQGLARLDLRIGISRGEVVAGIVGDLKFCYDIYGDTVNTASRMCKFALPNHIQCTGEVASTLRASPEGFRLENAGKQEIKGKGVMETFNLVGDGTDCAAADAAPAPGAMGGAMGARVGKWAMLRQKIATEKVSRLGKLLGFTDPEGAPSAPTPGPRTDTAGTPGHAGSHLPPGHVPLPGAMDADSLLAAQEEAFGAAVPVVADGALARPTRRQRRISVINGINTTSLRRAVARRNSTVNNGGRLSGIGESKVSLTSSSSSSIANMASMLNNASSIASVHSVTKLAKPGNNANGGNGGNGEIEFRPSYASILFPSANSAMDMQNLGVSFSNIPTRSAAMLNVETGTPTLAPPSPRLLAADPLRSASASGLASPAPEKLNIVASPQPTSTSTARARKVSTMVGTPKLQAQPSRNSVSTSRSASEFGGTNGGGGPAIIRRQEALASALGGEDGTVARQLNQLRTVTTHRFSLRFGDASIERAFVLHYAGKQRSTLIWFLFVCFAYNVILVVCDLVSDADPAEKRTILKVRLIGASLVCGIPAAVLAFVPRAMRHSQKIAVCFLVAIVAVNYTAILLNSQLSYDWPPGENFYGPNTTVLLLNTMALALPGLLFRHALGLVCCHAVTILIIYGVSGAKLYLFDLAFAAFSLIVVVLVRYVFEKFVRAHFVLTETARVQQNELEREKAMGEHLVHNILPPSIARLLASDPNCKTARFFPSVTVLAMDIAGFTAMSSKMTAENVVAMLNDLFCRFDALVLAISVEKIGTIGDAYIAACGAPEECIDHRDRIILLAMGMLRVIEERNDGLVDSMPRVSVRIGIHTGSCFGGVMGGQLRFKYDLYGRAMAIAQVLEQTGTPTCAHVSDATLVESSLLDPAIAELSGIEQSASGPFLANFAGTEETLETFLLRPIIDGMPAMSTLVPNTAHH